MSDIKEDRMVIPQRWVPNDCRRGIPGCFCVTGYRYKEMCSDCRDAAQRDRYSYCVCETKRS